jgi:hypothetical protein
VPAAKSHRRVAAASCRCQAGQLEAAATNALDFLPTTHEVLLELLRLGLSWYEARALSAEEVLCLLAHATLKRDLEALEAETIRIASLPFADPHEQQRQLLKLKHMAAGKLQRFYREL